MTATVGEETAAQEMQFLHLVYGNWKKIQILGGGAFIEEGALKRDCLFFI